MSATKKNMTITFDFPISESKMYQGQLHVSATVEYPDAYIDKVIFESRSGASKTDITELLEIYCESLVEKLQNAALNAWYNLQPDERYYDEELDKDNRFA
jgi:hypothetical protein